MSKAFIDEYGIHIPGYPQVLDSLKSEFRAIYGPDIYLEPDSQEGQLCAVFALRLYDCYTLAASVYNSYSPATAQGVGLSSVVKTNGIRRDTSSYSQVELRVIGQPGTILSNAIAADEAGQRWLLPDVVIPVSGEVMAAAQAENVGEVRAAPGEVKNIVTPIKGWQAVINPAAALPGAPVEHDGLLRQRQSISTALPSSSIFDGTAGAVAQLTGVSRSRGYENDTSQPDTHGIPPHSICFVVEGGDTQAIGNTLSLKKGPGCGTHGDILVETRDCYGEPNIVKFFRPVPLELSIAITIKPFTGYLATTGMAIRKNVFDYINALRIGDDILLSKLYTPINAAEPVAGQRTFDVLAVAIAKKGNTPAPVNFPVAYNAAALVCDIEDIELKDY